MLARESINYCEIHGNMSHSDNKLVLSSNKLDKTRPTLVTEEVSDYEESLDMIKHCK